MFKLGVALLRHGPWTITQENVIDGQRALLERFFGSTEAQLLVMRCALSYLIGVRSVSARERTGLQERRSAP